MATYSSILAWRIQWTEEPGGLQFMGSQIDTGEQLTLLFYFFHLGQTGICLTQGQGLQRLLCVCACVCLVTQSCLILCDPWTIVCQASLSVEFSRQGYWIGLHFFLQGIILTQGLNSRLLHFLHWWEGSLPLSHLGTCQWLLRDAEAVTLNLVCVQ